MGIVYLETFVNAPIERCFDLSRSVDLHIQSASHTDERAIGGVTSGLMKLDDVVIWEARHFGIKQKLTVRISAFDRPNSFRDSQVEGIFARFDHDHIFKLLNGGTLMQDVFDFQCPFGLVGLLVDKIVENHLRKFLTIRNATIKRIAESDEWRAIL